MVSGARPAAAPKAAGPVQHRFDPYDNNGGCVILFLPDFV